MINNDEDIKGNTLSVKDLQAAEEYANKAYTVLPSLREHHSDWTNCRDGFLAGIQHERERVRSGEPDYYVPYLDGIPQSGLGATSLESVMEIFAEHGIQMNQAWRIVPVKLIEIGGKEDDGK